MTRVTPVIVDHPIGATFRLRQEDGRPHMAVHRLYRVVEIAMQVTEMHSRRGHRFSWGKHTQRRGRLGTCLPGKPGGAGSLILLTGELNSPVSRPGQLADCRFAGRL